MLFSAACVTVHQGVRPDPLALVGWVAGVPMPTFSACRGISAANSSAAHTTLRAACMFSSMLDAAVGGTVSGRLIWCTYCSVKSYQG